MNDRAFISLLDCVFNGRPIKKTDVKPRKASRKESVVVEVDINGMWKRATDVVFKRLQSTTVPVSIEDLYDLIVPFGSPDQMRCCLRYSHTAQILLGDQYDQVDDLVKRCVPFVIVIRSGNDVYAVANPLEDIH